MWRHGQDGCIRIGHTSPAHPRHWRVPRGCAMPHQVTSYSYSFLTTSTLIHTWPQFVYFMCIPYGILSITILIYPLFLIKHSFLFLHLTLTQPFFLFHLTISPTLPSSFVPLPLSIENLRSRSRKSTSVSLNTFQTSSPRSSTEVRTHTTYVHCVRSALTCQYIHSPLNMSMNAWCFSFISCTCCVMWEG